LPEIKELRNDEKWDLFDKHVQKHLKFQEDAKPQAFKLFWKMAAKAWRQLRFQLRQDFIKKGLEPFTRHPFIIPEQWKEFMKQAELSKPHLLVSSSKNSEAGTQASTTWV
jgi:diadenosine tetraphosphate (Ap4A) HIT family hydrolase